jgi:hypothetical protein
MNTITEKLMQLLGENYLPSNVIHLNEDKFIYLGDKDNRKCRFCGKQKPEVTFNNVAHAIPEFVNNKRLIAYYECDDCNSKFSKLLESHMANYMNLYHTLSQVRGKNGVPSFKSNKKKSRIDITTSNIQMESHEDDDIFEIDEKNNTIKITGTRATYIPIAIYKCLTKMALTIMPENELNNFKHTLDWINEEDHSVSKYNLKSLIALFSFAPGPKPFDFVTCELFKRRPDHKKTVPYMLFLLAYGNYTFQIYLPLCKEDLKFVGGNFEMIYIPTPIDMGLDNKIIPRQKIDLNSKDKVKGEKASISMHYEHMEDKTNEIK